MKKILFMMPLVFGAYSQDMQIDPKSYEHLLEDRQVVEVLSMEDFGRKNMPILFGKESKTMPTNALNMLVETLAVTYAAYKEEQEERQKSFDLERVERAVTLYKKEVYDNRIKDVLNFHDEKGTLLPKNFVSNTDLMNEYFVKPQENIPNEESKVPYAAFQNTQILMNLFEKQEARISLLEKQIEYLSEKDVKNQAVFNIQRFLLNGLTRNAMPQGQYSYEYQILNTGEDLILDALYIDVHAINSSLKNKSPSSIIGNLLSEIKQISDTRNNTPNDPGKKDKLKKDLNTKIGNLLYVISLSDLKKEPDLLIYFNKFYISDSDISNKIKGMVFKYINKDEKIFNAIPGTEMTSPISIDDLIRYIGNLSNSINSLSNSISDIQRSISSLDSRIKSPSWDDNVGKMREKMDEHKTMIRQKEALIHSCREQLNSMSNLSRFLS